MFVDFQGSVLGIIRWQAPNVGLFLGMATGVAALHYTVGVGPVALPALPVAIVGGAIGIFASFRTNSAYDRWWEGRKLWGRLINVSRHFTSQCLVYFGARDEGSLADAHRMIRRHIAYVHVLRCLLRAQDPLQDRDVLAFLTDDEKAALAGDSNMTHALLHRQMIELSAMSDAGRLDGLRLQSLDESIRVMLDVQGGCERIKKTPMPGSYGFIVQRLIQAFGMLLPLALVHEIGWLTIPVCLLVALAFQLISEVGRVTEDPFTLFWPALPLFALSKTIEVNLMQRMGETEHDEIPRPVRGVLM